MALAGSGMCEGRAGACEYDSDDLLIDLAIDNAIATGRRGPALRDTVDREGAKRLLDVERAWGIEDGDPRRGITLAIWVHESSMTSGSRAGDRGNAVGPMQIWPGMARGCQLLGSEDGRLDLVMSGSCWLDTIDLKLSKVRRICGYRTDLQTWWTAEYWASKGRSAKQSCSGRSGHYRRLQNTRGR